MRVRFLETREGHDGNRKWGPFKKGKTYDAKDLPSGEASAFAWIDQSIAILIEEDPVVPLEEGSDAPKAAASGPPASSKVVPDVTVESVGAKRRGRPPKSQAAEARA